MKSQNDEGGWRYEPYARESDMSIVVCQVIALRAARNIGDPRAEGDGRHARRATSSARRTRAMLRRAGASAGAVENEIGTFHYQKE